MAIFQDDKGAILRIETGEDLSVFVTVELHVMKPDASIETNWTVEYEGASTLGVIAHTIVAGELDQIGTYSYHVYTEATGAQFLSTKGTFTVLEKWS